MRFKKRYKFWHILVGIVALGLFFFIMYLISNPSMEELTTETKSSGNETFGDSIEPLLSFIYIVTFFYFAMNLYYTLIADNRKFSAFVRVTGTIILVGFLYHSFLYFVWPDALHGKYKSLAKLFFFMLGSMIPMLILSYLFAYVTNMREALKQRRELQAQKMQLEAQISQANFNFLKAQINPHFLHNTLNFLYAKSLPYSSELSEGILTLSDIMRYALSQGNQKDGKAPLKDEIEHVQNVIKISQLRFSNQLKVNFEVNGQVNGAMIIPFVLITLVENAFKHGELKNPDYPIDIKLSVSNNRLLFHCRNRKKTGPKQLSTGIGLENIKKRLDLAYGKMYSFIVKDEPEFYTTELTIEQL